ncbi:hypothetical protein FDH34_gp531 [Serratia phage BF]|uniref:Uncharacterized protein n=2 Tax=Eneladusvirus BF TaxID=2560751 RepID=A0A7L8ZLX1_9CAUD|nr:hypothetical protein FDH34_gp531 [Serratia phage BF]AQW88914.1 hypothetical protein BF_0389 [Serratia phage BF]QOI71327.1 hypothetical protein pEaSNUABM12_00393 [Erwinia phage pEa_SNUABM_12]QXO11536.1 hypothetical protein pEaSNUABM19_00394 [Erwinia phage pEa_SNUABM_19]QXO12636.1 hypothetical protein pEaSNUABM49_00394 [Erwinia phage pEa_SNUABM_49]
MKDPNLNNEFIDFLADEFPEVSFSTTYVHWHPSVGEYCVYINDTWSGYVPEEYIFKAGFEYYTLWSKYWEKYRQTEIFMDLNRKYVQSIYNILQEENTTESDISLNVRILMDIIRNRSYPTDYQNFTIKMILEVLQNKGYNQYTEMLENIIGEINDLEENKRSRRKVL